MNRSEKLFLEHCPVAIDLRGKLPTGKGRWPIRDVDKIHGLVYHQALANTNSFAAISKYHTGPDCHIIKGGVPSISYTLGVNREGQIAILNDFKCSTYSHGYTKRPGDENAEFLGVLFLGNFYAADNRVGGSPTADQLDAALKLALFFQTKWGLTPTDIWGHYHFGKPACPGDALKAVIETIRNPVATAGAKLVIKQRQKLLSKYSGVTISVDGDWGPQSRGALVAFQRKYNLIIDGIWGPQVQTRMDQLGAGR